MRKNITCFLCIFFVLILTFTLTAQSTYVPLSSKIYDFFERFEAKGVLDRALNGTKPFSRKEAASFLRSIRSEYDNGYSLSAVEEQQLVYFEQEFREELEEIDPSYSVKQIEYPVPFKNLLLKFPGDIYRNGRNLFSYSGEQFSLYFDPILNQDNSVADNDTLSSPDKVYRYASGFRVRGILGNRLGYYFNARNTKEWGSRDYPMYPHVTSPGLGWVKNYGDYRFHDETVAYVVLHVSPIEIEFGKNINKWGPGYRGSLMLSDNATSFDLVKLKFRYGRVKYVHLHGSLTAYPRIVESMSGFGSSQKIKYASKYIAAHRLEINLAKGIDIGLNEAVIYGQRDIELAYLNPIMFLRSAEHYLGDQDNALMGADIEIYRISGWKWYGELLIDDIFTTRLGTKWFGNKLGFLCGALWIDPAGFRDTSIRIEYSRIKPFVYTHRFPVNVYKHFDTGLGHRNGPNTDEWYIRGTHYFTRRLTFSLDISYFRHGANPPGGNAGGSINLAHRNQLDSDEIGFLEGEIQRIKSFNMNVSFEPFRNLFVQGFLNLESGNNFRIMGLPGRNYSSRRFFIAVRMNY